MLCSSASWDILEMLGGRRTRPLIVQDIARIWTADAANLLVCIWYLGDKLKVLKDTPSDCLELTGYNSL